MPWTFTTPATTAYPSERNHLIQIKFPAGVCPKVDQRGLPVFRITASSTYRWSILFEFQDLDVGDGVILWDTGVEVDSLQSNLDIICDVQGINAPPRTQTVTIQRGGGSGPNGFLKPTTKSAGKKARFKMKGRKLFRKMGPRL